jgi:hypothetical protein
MIAGLLTALGRNALLAGNSTTWAYATLVASGRRMDRKTVRKVLTQVADYVRNNPPEPPSSS